MPDEQNKYFGTVPHPSEEFGNVRNDSEAFRNIPKSSETVRNVPNPAEPFRTLPKLSERKEDHVLTVREAARMFEAAGAARTERSITNWCQPNRSGVPRLDAYFDSNDRKYFITPQSVNAAIKEELAKAAQRSEPFNNVPERSEEETQRSHNLSSDGREVEDLRFKLREAEISSRVKDQYISKLEVQHEKTLDQLVSFSRTIGQLETKLLQLDAPEASSELAEPRRVHVVSEREENGSEPAE